VPLRALSLRPDQTPKTSFYAEGKNKEIRDAKTASTAMSNGKMWRVEETRPCIDILLQGEGVAENN
jgi:hypothetical protein